MDQAVTSTITHYAVFDIDNVNSSYSEISIPNTNQDAIKKFLIRMSADTRSSNSTRKCSFKNNSYIKTLISEILSSSTPLTSKEKLAEHLAICEADSNTQYPQLNQIKKGNLIIARTIIGNQESILITKIDIEEYFQSSNLALSKGLPKEKGLLKSCLIDIYNNSMGDYFIIADSNNKISSYWVNDFIAATFFRDDKQNTETAISLITKALSPINRQSPEDHTQIKQNFFSYLHTAEQYNHDEMIESVIGSYVPVSDKVDTKKIKAKLIGLIDKDKFDGSFEIDTQIVKEKSKMSFKLDNDIVLKINNDVSNIFHKVIDGQPYVLIKTQTGYKTFKELTSTSE